MSYDNYNRENPYDLRYKNWTSGSVCGLDPRYCDETHIDSSMINTTNGVPEWKEDGKQSVKIDQWPLCTMDQQEMLDYGSKEMPNMEPAPWMTCEKIASPCCIGTEGRCEIVTPDYCDAMQGTKHPNASLCSQV